METLIMTNMHRFTKLSSLFIASVISISIITISSALAVYAQQDYGYPPTIDPPTFQQQQQSPYGQNPPAVLQTTPPPVAALQPPSYNTIPPMSTPPPLQGPSTTTTMPNPGIQTFTSL